MKRAHLFIILLFLGVTLSHSFKIVGTIGYYALFTDNFIENFCENKEKPELNCDGKCALSKMLIQDVDNEKTPINLDWLKSETVLFYGSTAAIKFLNPTPIKINRIQYLDLYSFTFSQSITHPPQV